MPDKGSIIFSFSYVQSDINEIVAWKVSTYKVQGFDIPSTNKTLFYY